VVLKPENLGAKRLSRPTINAKAIGTPSVVMRCAKTLGFVQTNPCSDQALDMKKGDAKKRKAYSLADLKRIFLCGAFAPRPRITKDVASALSVRSAHFLVVTPNRSETGRGGGKIHATKLK